MVSSVAFSLYDGGDSEDESDEEEEELAIDEENPVAPIRPDARPWRVLPLLLSPP
jgi:hypothetical protein